MPDLPTFPTYDGVFVSRRLALGSCLRPQHVPEFAAAGLRGIINLVAICDAKHIAYVHHLPPSIHWQHLAFWDGWYGPNIPGYRERLTAGYATVVVRKAAEFLRDRGTVMIHCMGGVGRAGNLTAILLAAMENLTPDEAIDHLRQYRQVSPFAHQGFWLEAGSEAMVALAREVLSQPGRYPQGVSPFLSEGWHCSRLQPAADLSTVPCVGLAADAGWEPAPHTDEFVDIHERRGDQGFVYLARRLSVPQAGDWLLHVGHDGGARVFVDGQPVACATGTVNPAPYLRTQARVHLTEGDHELVMALDRDGGRGWGIFACFTPTEAMQMPGRAVLYPH